MLRLAVRRLTVACLVAFSWTFTARSDARAAEKAAQSLRPALSGLIPAPSGLPGGNRWQILTLRPRGTISCFDLSSDGSWSAFADDAVVRVCQTKGFVLHHVLVGHRGRVRAVAWSPDGTKIATASVDGTARLWDKDGTPLAQLGDQDRTPEKDREGPGKGHEGVVTDVVWSRDGRTVATSGDDGTVRLWSLDGTAGVVIRGGEAAINCVCFSPDGARLAAGDEDRVLWIWKRDGTLIAKCLGHHGPIQSVDWNPDGSLIASGCQGYVPRDGRGDAIASIRLWSPAGASVRSLDGPTSIVTSVRWDREGKKLAGVSEDFRVRIWTRAGDLTSNLFCDRGGIVRWMPEGKRIVTASSSRITLFTPGVDELNQRGDDVLDEQARRNGILFDRQLRVEKVQWNPSGKTFAALALDGKLRFFDETGRSVRTVDIPIRKGLRPDLSWRPKANEILIVGFTQKPPIYDFNTNKIRRLPIDDHYLTFAQWSPDGQLIAATDYNQLYLYSADGKLLKMLQGHKNRVEALAWSPDGKQFATGSTDATMRVWNADGSPGRVFEGFSGDVDSVAWSPDGESLAAGMDDGTWRRWKLDGTEGPTQNSSEPESISAMAFSPDGKHVATGSWLGTIAFWNATGGEPITISHDHVGPIMSISWSPDGKRLLSASRDNTLRIWNTQTHACEAVVLTMTDGTTATFSATGELIDGKPESLAKDLRYVVERKGGKAVLLTFSDFKKLSPTAK